jgi:hypothetical protein
VSWFVALDEARADRDKARAERDEARTERDAVLAKSDDARHEYDEAFEDYKRAYADLIRANETISRLTGELSAARADVAAYRERDAAKPPPLTPEQRNHLLKNRCNHCGGVHAINCPRLKRIRFRADGQTPYEIEYWSDAEWPKDQVVWIESLFEEPPALVGEVIVP